MAISHCPSAERPREKLLEIGERQLANSELLAIILGSGNRQQNAVELAQEILHSANNNLAELAKLNLADLQRFKGIGEAKAINIIAALELGKRRKSTSTPQRKQINSSQDGYDSLSTDLTDLPHEEFWVLFLKKTV